MWLSVRDCSFTQGVLNIHQSGYSTVWLFYGWCHVKLSQCRFCVHHATMHQFTVSFIWSCICKIHVCLALTCHLHFWQNDWDLLHATEVTRSGTDTEIRVSSREENPPAFPAGTRTRDLLIMSLSLYHWAIPAPQFEYWTVVCYIITDTCPTLVSSICNSHAVGCEWLCTHTYIYIYTDMSQQL